MPGRIECHIHSDNATQNKAGSLVEITCETDFAAKAENFKKFTSNVAMLACGFQCEIWDELKNYEPTIGTAKEKLEEELREKITVKSIVVRRLQ